MRDLLTFLKDFFSKYKVYILLAISLIIAVFLLLKSYSNNMNLRHQYQNNINALTEQVQIWETKNGDLVAEKTLLEGDLKLLKQTNEDLYDQVKKLKAKPNEVVYVETEIVNEVHDTSYVVSPLTDYFKQPFDFSNQYRTLNGYIEYNNPNLGLKIENDIVNANFTIAIKDSKVYVTSTNPYIKYNDIQGIVIPKYKPKWSIGIGPSINFGYDVLNKQPGVMVGVALSLNYNLITF